MNSTKLPLEDGVRLEVKWAVFLAAFALLFWLYHLPVFRANVFPSAIFYTVLQISNEDGRVLQALSASAEIKESSRSLSGMRLPDVQKKIGTAEIALPVGAKIGDVLLYDIGKNNVMTFGALKADQVDKGSVTVKLPESHTGRHIGVENIIDVRYSGDARERQQVKVLRQAQEVSPFDYHIEFSKGENGVGKVISLVSPKIELTGSTSRRDTYPCGDPCSVESEKNGESNTLIFKSMKFDFKSIYWAIGLSALLGGLLAFSKFGNVGIFVALSALFSVRLFMAASLMRSQIDYAPQVFMAALELLLIPLVMARFSCLRQYIGTGMNAGPSVTSILWPLFVALICSVVWSVLFVFLDIDGALNSIGYFTALNWTGVERKYSYWAELGFLAGLLVAYVWIFCHTPSRRRLAFNPAMRLLLIILTALLAIGMSSGGAGRVQVPSAGLIILFAPWAIFILFGNDGTPKKIWAMVPAALVILLFSAFFLPGRHQDIGAMMVYLPAIVIATYLVYVFPITDRKSVPQWLISVFFFLCLTVLAGMVGLKSHVIAGISSQLGPKNGGSASINEVSTRKLLCVATFCTLDDWFMPVMLPERAVSSLKAKEVLEIDDQLRKEYLRYGDGINNKMRIYGWLVGHPFDRIVFNASYRRLEGLERAKASSIPKDLFFGDADVVDSGKITRSASALDGYQYEHAVGIYLIRPLGLSVCLFVWLAFLCLYYSVPRTNRPARCLILTILFSSIWLMLQTQGVFPISGQSLPLLMVNSLSKDFFPVLMALIVYISLFSESPPAKEMETV